MKKRILSFIMVLSMLSSCFVTVMANYNDSILIDGNDASTWRNAKGESTSESANGAYATDNAETCGVDANVKAGINAGWAWSNNSALMPMNKRSVAFSGKTFLVDFDVEIPDDETFALASKYLVLSMQSTGQNENQNITVGVRNNNEVYELYARIYYELGGVAYYTIAQADSFDELAGWHHVKLAIDTQKFRMAVYNEDGTTVYSRPLNEGNADLIFTANTKMNYAAIMPNNSADTINAKKISYNNFYIKTLERGLTAEADVNAQTTSAELDITFSEEVDTSNISDLITVTAPSGNTPEVSVEAIDATNAKIILTGLLGNTEYGVSVDKIFAKSGRTSEGALIDTTFKTSKAAGIYVDAENSSLSYNGTDISDSTEISYAMDVLNTTASDEDVYAGVVLYSSDEELLDFDIKALTSTVGTVEQDFSFNLTNSGAEKLRAYIWKNTNGALGELITSEIIEGSYVSTDVQTSKVMPEFETKVTDAENAKLTIMGNFADATEKYVTVAFVHGEKTEFDFNDADIVAFSPVKTDSDGSFAYEFKITPVENQYDYTAFILTDSEVYKSSFYYMPISIMADCIKKIADGEIAKDDIFGEVEALNNGFGINIDKYFSNDERKSAFNEEIYAARTSFVGPSDTEYLNQFMNAVNALIQKYDFLAEVKAAANDTELLAVLQNNTELTNIDFAAYDALSNAQQKKALSYMIGKDYASPENVRESFNTFVESVKNIKYINNGYMNFDNLTSVTNGGSTNSSMKFDNANATVVNDDVAKEKGETNKALRVAPKKEGTKFNFGLINTGQFDDIKYTSMGADTSKLMMMAVDVYFPSQLLEEEYMLSSGINLMPGVGNYVYDGMMYTGAVFKKEAETDTVLSFVQGINVLKEIKMDTWYNVMLIYDFTTKTFRYYIDNELLITDEAASNAIDTSDMGTGFLYRCPANASADAAIYFDNIEIYQISEKLTADINYDAETDKLSISFSSPIDSSMADKVSVSVGGKTISGIPVISADSKSLVFNLSGENLKNDKEYTIDIKFDELFADAYGQYFNTTERNISGTITTARNKIMYLSDDCGMVEDKYKAVVVNNGSAAEATVAVAVYDENGQMLGVPQFVTQTFAKGNNELLFEGIDATKEIKAYLWTGNWELMHNPVVTNKQEKITQTTSQSVIPDYSAVITDAGNEIVTVSGKYNGEADSFVTIMISESANIAEYETKTIVLGSARTDENGLFNYSFKFSKPSAKYTVFVVVDGTVYPKEFDYASLTDTTQMVKKVANGEIAKDNIYSTAILMNSGLGIDNVNYFTNDTQKALFNKRIDQNKSAFTGPSDAEYVSQFMAVVNNVIKEIDYTKELEAIPYSGNIISKLEEGIDYTGINFTAYNALTLYQKSLVCDNMLAATFNDGDDIKSKFDGYVANAKGKVQTTGGGSSGGGSSGRGSIFAMPGVTNNVTTHETKDLFYDITVSHWAAAAIARLVDKNIASGFDDGYYRPDDNITREQFVKLVVASVGQELQNGSSGFDDVPSGAWYESYITTARNNGIVNGISDNMFGIGANVTRQDMAVIICNILKSNNADVTETDSSFSDFDEVSDYAKEAVSCLYANGIINGMGDGSFAPSGFATRAQAAVIVDRMINMLGK